MRVADACTLAANASLPTQVAPHTQRGYCDGQQCDSSEAVTGHGLMHPNFNGWTRLEAPG